jgi:hypothetical protein
LVPNHVPSTTTAIPRPTISTTSTNNPQHDFQSIIICRLLSIP